MKLIIAVRATPRPPRRTGSLHKKLRKRLRAQAREQAIQNRQRLDQRSRIQSQAQQAARLAQAVMENQARQLQTQAANLVHQPNAARLRPANLAHQLSAEILLAPQQGQMPRHLAQNHHPLQAKVLLAMRRDPRLQTNNIWLPNPCIHHALAAAKAICAARKSDRADNAARNHAHHYPTHNHNQHHNHAPYPQTISQIDSYNATQIY